LTCFFLSSSFFFLTLPPPPLSTLFPYTTLFRSVVETANPSLAVLPILTCWPRDGGRYITLPAVFTRDPVTGARNVGMYRLQVFEDRKSTRLNSSHLVISYAVFCLKKKKKKNKY